MLRLTRSLTFGLASLALRHWHARRHLALWRVITPILGLLFLYFEMREIAGMIAKDAGPSRSGFLSTFLDLYHCVDCMLPSDVSGSLFHLHRFTFLA